MTDTVVEPDQTVWWDPEVTLGAVLAQLRLTGADIDSPRLEALIPAAGYAINVYLDRVEALPGPPPPALAQAALEQVVVELYRRKDAGSGNPTDYAVQALVNRYGAVDPLGEVRAQLQPFKRRFGVG